MLSGVASNGVDAKGPSGHVGKQGDQEGDADDLEEHGVAHHSLDCNDHAVVGVDGIGRYSCADAKASEQVDNSDGHTTDDDCLGDVLGRIGHIIGHGADNLKAHEVEDDDGQIAQSVGVGELGEEGVCGHIVRKTVLHSKPDAQSANDNGHGDLDQGATVEDPLGVGSLGATHEVDDPHKGKLDTHLGNDVELNTKNHAQDVGEHGCQGGDPQGVVDPVVVRDTSAPFIAQAIADPVVNAAVTVVGGSQLGNNHAVGKQEREDQEDPPEELLVANGSSRCGGLAHEDDANDGRNDRQEGKLFLSVTHNKSFAQSFLDRAPVLMRSGADDGRQETGICRPSERKAIA